MIYCAVIGQGHIGKRHAEMIQRNKDAELVAVCDIVPQEREDTTSATVPFFTSVDALLNANLRIDVIHLCIPNGLHAEYAIKILEKGYHVVVEKPLALTKKDAERIEATARTVGKQVFCVHQNRYSPPSVWLKKLVTEKGLGNIYMVQLNCYWNRDERYYKPGNWHGTHDLDGGTLFTQFSHFVDMLYWLFGDITNIRGNFKDFAHQDLTEFEDSGVVTFDFVNGGIGSLNYSTAVWDKNLESSIMIIGEKGSVKVSGQYMDSIAYRHIQNEQFRPQEYSTITNPRDNHQYVIQQVVDTLQRKQDTIPDLSEDIHVIDIIERIYHIRDAQWKKNR